MPPEGNGNGDGEGLDAAVTALNDVVKGLPEHIQKSVSAGVSTVIQQAQADAANARTDDDEDDDPDVGAGAVDLEGMTRAEFGDAIANKIMKSVNKVVKEVSKSQEADRLANARKELAADLKKTQKEHPDFLEFKEEIATLAQTYPDLTPEDLYLLARHRNPDKVKELEAKATEAKKKEDEEKKKGDQRRFGGLTPTSGVGATEKSGRMERADAVEAAWEEAFDGIPTSLIGDSHA